MPGNEFFVDDISLTMGVGVEEINNTLNLNIFPNPFDNSTLITFENSGNSKFNLVLMNIQGEVVRTINDINGESVEIQRKDLTDGMYFLQLFSESTLVAVRKLILCGN